MGHFGCLVVGDSNSRTKADVKRAGVVNRTSIKTSLDCGRIVTSFSPSINKVWDSKPVELFSGFAAKSLTCLGILQRFSESEWNVRIYISLTYTALCLRIDSLQKTLFLHGIFSIHQKWSSRKFVHVSFEINLRFYGHLLCGRNHRTLPAKYWFQN